jgi:2-keto-4-pentenoate hydratase
MADDARVVDGMSRQGALLRHHLDRGDTQVGWKFGFGSPGGLELLSLTAPLVGFLLASAERPDGSTVDVSDWRAPVVEPEIAVRLGTDLPAGAGPDEVISSVSSLVPALELADVDPPPSDVAEILAGDIFQRLFILGDEDGAGWQSGPQALRGEVSLDAEVTPVTDMQALTGDLARVADRFGRGLRAGDIILMGSVTPPSPFHPGDSASFRVEGKAAVSAAAAPRSP